MAIICVFVGTCVLIGAFFFQYVVIRDIEKRKALVALAQMSLDNPVKFELLLARTRWELSTRAVQRLTVLVFPDTSGFLYRMFSKKRTVVNGCALPSVAEPMLSR